MRYPRQVLCIVGLLVPSIAIPAFAQDAVTLEDFKSAIEALEGTPDPSHECDPFVDPECNTSGGVKGGDPNQPKGCTDCMILQWNEYLSLGDGLIINVPEIEAGGTKFILRQDITDQFLNNLPLSPEVGF